jgi:hypothetical protein
MTEKEYHYGAHDHPERVYYVVSFKEEYEVPSNSNPFPDNFSKPYGEPVYTVDDVNALLVRACEKHFIDIRDLRVHIRCRQGESNDQKSDSYHNGLDSYIKNYSVEGWSKVHGPISFAPEPIEVTVESHITYRLTGYFQDESTGYKQIHNEDFENLRLAAYRLNTRIGYGTMSDGKWKKQIPFEVIESVIECLGRFDAKMVMSPTLTREYTLERVTTPYND